MPHDVYYQFIQTLEQARRVGARGGKATARKRRECLDSAAPEAGEPQAEAGPQVHSETTAAAMALLDAQYPWLRGAEERFSHRSRRPNL
jgi:hypothetical protein